jgi:hypothetical protein
MICLNSAGSLTQPEVTIYFTADANLTQILEIWHDCTGTGN